MEWLYVKNLQPVGLQSHAGNSRCADLVFHCFAVPKIEHGGLEPSFALLIHSLDTLATVLILSGNARDWTAGAC